MVWGAGGLVVLLGGFTALSLTRGQAPPPAPPAETTSSPRPSPPAAAVAGKAGPGADPSKLDPLQRQMYWNAQRGADWLYRMNGRDGRFVHGLQPALNAPLEGSHYLRQIGAAYALARAARYLGDERYAARATQALLLLLSDTATDPKDPEVRYPALPSALVNRLGAAGLLVLAVHELPAPKDDLLLASAQLCNYIRRRQRPDGSLAYTEEGDDLKADPEGVNHYPGVALCALTRSLAHRPEPWKLDVVAKAFAYYRPWWRAHKSMAFVPWHAAAYAEAFLRTREKDYAGFVFEMNDWLCGLQYDRLDPQRPFWLGGFMGWADGKPVPEAPHALGAAYAEALVEGCRAAREAGDPSRHQRYGEALVRGLQFVATLQYTTANTQHFADWYQERLLGGFHGSHQDGNLRLDYTQHAVAAMVHYLTHVR
jgi:hypothetical protein